MPADAVLPAGFVLSDVASGDGPWNMAVDEWLLSRAINFGHCQLRFYGWREPTLSLGYFQHSGQPELPEPLQSLPRVRRLTGGGAILHDREWTYSLSIPASHPLASTPVELYRTLHGWVIAALAAQGVTATFRGSDQAERNGAFLCFLRGDRNDLLIGTHKILGSAQRRRKGAVLQHGSLVLAASPLAEEIPGIAELAGVELNLTQFQQHLIDACADLVSGWRPHELSLDERAEIESLTDRYRLAST